jgi:hypothetical protein
LSEDFGADTKALRKASADANFMKRSKVEALTLKS